MGLIKATWEEFLQHINISKKLIVLDNTYLHFVFNFEEEIKICCEKLGVENNIQKVTLLRSELRSKEFGKLTSLSSKGKRAILFQEYAKGN